MAQIGTACKNYPNKKHGSTAGNSCWAVLSFFSLSAVRSPAGRKAWLGVARQTWQALICFREIRLCFCFFRCLRGGLLPGARLGLVWPSSGRKAWLDAARQTWQALICSREIRSCFRFLPPAGRPSAGCRDWLGVARQTWQALICFRENRSCFRFFHCLRCGFRLGARLGLMRRGKPGKTLICFREIRLCFCFFRCLRGGLLPGARLGLVWPSSGRKAWLDAARQTWQALICSREIRSCFRFLPPAGRPSAGCRDWLGVARQTWQALICFRENRSCFRFFHCLRCGFRLGARLGLMRRGKPAKL